MPAIERGDAGFEKLAQDLMASEKAAQEYAHGHARVIYNSIMAEIAAFEESLREDQEIACSFPTFAPSTVVRIDSIKFSNPYLIIFEGREAVANTPVKIIQHTTQVNVLFTPCSLQSGVSRTPRRLGLPAKA